MDSTRRWTCSLLAGAASLVVLCRPVVCAAQGRTSVEIAPLVTIQPAGYENALPYLDHGVGGVQPGLSLALQRRTGGNVLLALEVSTSRELRTHQSGRLVSPESGAPCNPFPGSGCGPAEARHRDTLVSGLVGKRFAWDPGGIEMKAGVSAIFGEPSQGSFTYEDAAGHVALTAGIDAAILLDDRVELVPSFRYSHAFRGENDFYVGLGSNIFRIGLGVRVMVSGS